jgi:phosphoribosylformylglycinamidine cyclo-ligase
VTDPGLGNQVVENGAAARYAAAGVDVDAGARAVELMRASVARASRPEVVGGFGGFAGLFALDTARYRRPLLASSTDGVGTKIAIARALDRHDSVGLDLVGMVVDDLVVCGAEPLFLLDYIACGSLVPERIAAIVAGIAAGCEQAGCALVGGETAEHPGLMAPDDYDLAGTGVGVVEADDLLGPDRVRAGDALVAMASSGLHSNGYSLVRYILAAGTAGTAGTAGGETGAAGSEVAGLTAAARGALGRFEADLGMTLGEALLVPTRIYARDCLALARDLPAGSLGSTGAVRAFAHITGGGLAANLGRVIPAGLTAVVRRSTWTPPPLFGLLARRGGLTRADTEGTFNLGVGMVAVVEPAAADAAVALLGARGVPSWVAGEVVARGPDGPPALLLGTHSS